MNRSRSRSLWREYATTMFWTLVLFLTFRTSVAEAYRIPTPSMESTLLVGDFLFASKLEYGGRIPFTDARLPGFREPRPGDVIVFRYPNDPSQSYIKRCIATAGQTVEIRHKRVFVDGRPLAEPYVQHLDPREMPASFGPRDNMPPLTVPPGHLFMMGDNRDNSSDSRFWGPLAKEEVQGRAAFIYWSVARPSPGNELPRPRVDRLLRPIR